VDTPQGISEKGSSERQQQTDTRCAPPEDATTFPRRKTLVASVGAFCVLAPTLLASQSARVPRTTAPHVSAHDSIVVRAGARYRASAWRRFWLGGGYRDLWTTPVRVPVLDVRTFAGGLVATRMGGGAQTQTLRFQGKDGRAYVFRPLLKEWVVLPALYRGTVVESVIDDGVMSQSHPAAALIVPPFLAAAGVPHARPVLVVMPNDTRLGRFREAFAGKVGMLEEYPSASYDAPAFAGAFEIIDSDTLLARLDADPRERLDAPVFLAARLVDALLNDTDRHMGQWKWARFERVPYAPWVPIPRDRDRALVSFEGALHTLARLARPELVRLTARYPEPRAMFRNALAFDERLIGALEPQVWDSVARALARTITDSVIDVALMAVPPEYRSINANLASTLRARRDAMPAFAERYYRSLKAIRRSRVTGRTP
jgi:hypothetical protein